jgi:hypothetical protein
MMEMLRTSSARDKRRRGRVAVAERDCCIKLD